MISSRCSLTKWGGEMNKMFLLALANIRKTKGQTVILTLLFFISSMMLNIGLIVLLGFGSYFERTIEELNTSDVYILIPKARYTEDVEQFFTEHDDIESFQVNNAISGLFTFKWDLESTQHYLIICDI